MILNYIWPKNDLMDFNTTTPREMRDYAQLKSYLENRDNEVTRVLQSRPYGTPLSKVDQLITKPTR